MTAVPNEIRTAPLHKCCLLGLTSMDVASLELVVLEPDNLQSNIKLTKAGV